MPSPKPTEPGPGPCHLSQSVTRIPAITSLTRGGNPGELGGIDEMGMIVLAEVDLHDVQPAGESARAGVVVADRHSVVVADVRGLVGGEDQRLGVFHSTGAGTVTVVVQGD